MPKKRFIAIVHMDDGTVNVAMSEAETAEQIGRFFEIPGAFATTVYSEPQFREIRNAVDQLLPGTIYSIPGKLKLTDERKKDDNLRH